MGLEPTTFCMARGPGVRERGGNRRNKRVLLAPAHCGI